MRHPLAEQDHAEVEGALYGSDERADRIETDEICKNEEDTSHLSDGFNAFLPSHVEELFSELRAR